MVGDILQPTHLLLLLIVALVVLGPKRLPEAGRALGNGLRDFRAAISGEASRDDLADRDELPSGAAAAPAPAQPTPIDTPVAVKPAPTDEPVAVKPAPTDAPVAVKPTPTDEPVAVKPAPTDEPVAVKPAPTDEPAPIANGASAAKPAAISEPGDPPR